MTDIAVLERRLERWSDDADASERALANVLATTLAATREALVGAAMAVLDMPRDIGERAAGRLLARPFVERLEDGFRINEPLAQRLRARFRESDYERYLAIADALVRTEAARLEEVSGDERWFARGRIAYYLAALDPAQSALSFIDVFAHPPPGDPGPPRSWLVDLAIKQQAELHDQSRMVAFFAGFQAYKEGRIHACRDNLERVLEGAERDAARAIALHLWVTLARGRHNDEELLRESIDLSRELGLIENEVMATNTLVYRMIGSARLSGDHEEIRRAAELADQNLSRAEESGDQYLRTWCLLTMARTRWLAESSMGDQGVRVPEELAISLLKTLRVGQRQAELTGDVESVFEAINWCAEIYRDRGEYENALATLTEGFGRWRDSEPPIAARRWGQTAGSMLRLPMGPKSGEELRRFLDRLDRWLKAPPSR